jgi:hypothetical protein
MFNLNKKNKRVRFEYYKNPTDKGFILTIENFALDRLEEYSKRGYFIHNIKRYESTNEDVVQEFHELVGDMTPKEGNERY